MSHLRSVARKTQRMFFTHANHVVCDFFFFFWWRLRAHNKQVNQRNKAVSIILVLFGGEVWRDLALTGKRKYRPTVSETVKGKSPPGEQAWRTIRPWNGRPDVLSSNGHWFLDVTGPL